MADAVESTLTSARSFLDDLIAAVSEADYAYEEKEDNEAFLRLGKKLAGWQYDGTFASHRDDLDVALRARAGGVVDVEALTYRVANAKLGEGPPVRCEGPTDFERDQARAWVKRVLAALAPSPSAGEPNKEDIARIVYSAMKWAAERAETGKPPEWVDRGNSLAQTQARWFASHITALYATPPATPLQPTASVEAVREARRHIRDGDPLSAWRVLDRSIKEASLAPEGDGGLINAPPISTCDPIAPMDDWPKDPETGLNDLSLGTLLRKTREEATPSPSPVSAPSPAGFVGWVKQDSLPRAGDGALPDGMETATGIFLYSRPGEGRVALYTHNASSPAGGVRQIAPHIAQRARIALKYGNADPFDALEDEELVAPDDPAFRAARAVLYDLEQWPALRPVFLNRSSKQRWQMVETIAAITRDAALSSPATPEVVWNPPRPEVEPPPRTVATPEPVPANGEVVEIEHDPHDHSREYIPLPGGWEVQTKGAGSSYRLLDKKTGERHAILSGEDWQGVQAFFTRFAHEVFAACRNVPSSGREMAPVRHVRHKKRGSTYEVLGEAEAQISTDALGDPIALGRVRCRMLTEGDKLAVYRDPQTSKLFVRFPDEFEDGRFEDIA